MSSGNFSIFAGDTKVITVTVQDDDGDAVTISSSTIEWRCIEDTNGTAALTKTTSDGISITDGSGGKFTITLTAGDTSFMSGDYYHEAQITFSDSTIMTILTGTMTVVPSVI